MRKAILTALIAALAAPALAADPVLLSVVSRKTHGAAGTFDLPVSQAAPTVEPRVGPHHAVVFIFDRPIAAAECYGYVPGPSYGAAVIAGNEVVCPAYVPYNGVWGGFNAVVTDGIGWAEGEVVVGFLYGDVNQSRAVTVADLAIVRPQIAQRLTPANFLLDVNASGAITVSDQAIVNSRIATGLPQ